MDFLAAAGSRKKSRVFIRLPPLQAIMGINARGATLAPSIYDHRYPH